MAMSNSEKQQRFRRRNSGDLELIDPVDCEAARAFESVVVHVMHGQSPLCGAVFGREAASIDMARHRWCVACSAQLAIRAGLLRAVIDQP